VDWFALTSTPFATVVMLVSGVAAIYFRQQIAGWLVKNDSSHVGRGNEYTRSLRQSFVYWVIGISAFLMLNAILNVTGPIKPARHPKRLGQKRRTRTIAHTMPHPIG
jgi:hypothetical protein